MSAPPRPDPEPPQAPIFRVLDDEQETQLKALSWVSYVLHMVVAVAAVNCRQIYLVNQRQVRLQGIWSGV